MNTTILITIVLVGLLVVSGVLYFAALSPAAQERTKLRRRAGLDFRDARGATHLKLMREARERHLQAQKRCQSALDEAKKHQADVEARQTDDLRRALVDHILQTRLREIPGIGQALAGQLRWHAQNHGGLHSLRSASQHVTGIGETRQAAIDHWVAGCEVQMPTLLAEDFPGKADIQRRATADLAAIIPEIEKLTVEQTTIAARLDRLRSEIDPLEHVTPHAIYSVLHEPGSMSDVVERYLRGAFAEWEPVPDWFKEIVEGVSD
jgi:hypothetical protein